MYDTAREDKVCIKVEPSQLRERLWYFYLPQEEMQDTQLYRMVSQMLEQIRRAKGVPILPKYSRFCKGSWEWDNFVDILTIKVMDGI